MDYGKWLLISQVALYPAFGLCYIPFILILPRILGVRGIYFSQPTADILTLLVCVFSVPAMKRIASANMAKKDLSQS